MPAPLFPTFSHGDTIPGTTQSAGRPVSIIPAITRPGFVGFFSGTTVTFLIEGNGGLVDSTGNPPASEWEDYSAGGITLTNGLNFGKFLSLAVPIWRTRITAITLGGGTGLVSYVPGIITPGGVWTTASHPRFSSPSN